MQRVNFVLFCLAFLSGGLGAWTVCRFGEKFSLIDEPNQRSSHKIATPKGGGIGILAAFIGASLFLSIPKSFWMPAALLSLFSFWGDRFDIPPEIRLFFQFIACFILLAGIFLTNKSPIWSYLLIPPFSTFIVGTANCYNFMDGIDGIAGITGLIGFGLLAYYGFSSGTDLSIVILSICISFSCFGFLFLNFPKAKVFMGDIGSILLGFVFASIVIKMSKNLLDFICLSIFLFPFYIDEVSTAYVRIRNGEKLNTPHRRHLYQLLANEKKIAHWKVSLGYGLSQLFVGAGILGVQPYGILAAGCWILFFSGVFLCLSFKYRHLLEDRSA